MRIGLLTKLIRISLTFAILLLAGCGANLYHKGRVAFEAKEYDEAIRLLEMASAKQPDKAAVWKQLGFAYYEVDQYEKSAHALRQASLLDASDGETVLFLGMSLEAQGANTEAVRVYSAYLDNDPDPGLAPRINKRVRYLTDQRLQEEVRAIISNEGQIDASKLPLNTVGILGFSVTGLDPQYEPLGRGLSEMLATDIAKIESFTVVERLRLNELVRELKLSESELVDRERAPRVGKLLGASTVISGDLSRNQEKKLAASATIVNTPKGLASYPDEAAGDLEQFFAMEKKLLYNILNEMGYAPSEDERERLDSVPTTSLLAFLAYSRGLEYADEGKYNLAEAEFEAAVKEDPQFGAAASAQRSVEGLGDYTGTIESRSELKPLISRHTAEAPPPRQTGAGLRDTRGFLGFNTRETVLERRDDPRVFPSVKGKVIVIGTFEPDRP
jgi:tetratricopeptide (TPR) repeat protein